METSNKIRVETIINAPIEKVWAYWTETKHITNWVFASNDWHAPYAENDLRTEGKFKTRMEAKDGSFGFDFEGIYTRIDTHRLIEYKMADERRVQIDFIENNNQVKVIEEFEPENENPTEMQKAGWQVILDNFKTYVEAG